MTREVTHLKAFSAALESLEKSPFSIGRLAVTPGIVDEYFNGSTGDGDEGDTDMRGPWQNSFRLHSVESQMNVGKGFSIGAIDGIYAHKAPPSRRGLCAFQAGSFVFSTDSQCG